MKSVILGNDFLKDTDGSFKFLETNTSCAFPTKDVETYINKGTFDTFLSDNQITKIDIITPSVGSILTEDDNIPNADFSENLKNFLLKYYSETHQVQTWVSENNVIPTIVDESDRLIIRVAYDTNALVDDTYCRDNFNFLKLMYDNNPNSIPKTYFNNGSDLNVDTIGPSIGDNGVYPNFIIKKRFPQTDYSTYPKIFKISTPEELQSLKTNLGVDEILQEYIANTTDLYENRFKTYRHYSFLYGGNLDGLDLFEPVVLTNKVSITTDIDYDENNEVDVWERVKLLQKSGDSKRESTYHGFLDDKIIMSDNSIDTVNNITISDNVKSLSLYNLSDDDEGNYVTWKIPKEDLISGSTETTTNVISKSTKNLNTFMARVTFTDGKVFEDVLGSTILTIRNNNTHFNLVQNLSVGDEVVIGDTTVSSLTTSIVSDVVYLYVSKEGYNLDVEDTDVYLKPLNSNDNQYVVKHNKEIECFCWYVPEFIDPGSCRCKSPCIYDGFECGPYRGYNFIDCCSSQPCPAAEQQERCGGGAPK